MKVRVLFFARLKELTGQEMIEFEIESFSRISDLWALLCKRFPELEMIGNTVIFSRNQEYAGMQTEIHEGDELAIFPPVSGGLDTSPAYPPNAAGDVIQIVYESIAVELLTGRLCQPADGAVVVFSGIVRNHTGDRRTLFLEYEGYVPMALSKMEEIARTVRQRWTINRVGIVHRLGRLQIGEISVVIIVTSAHRKAAFEACQYAIDTLKRIVPIWKKEYYEDGEGWIEEGWPDSEG